MSAIPALRMSAIDWPLSRDERKKRISSLYDDDVRAADSMLSSGDTALEALAEELDRVRQAAGVHKAVARKRATSDCESPASKSSEQSGEEVQRLRAVVENAAAVLRAILPTPDPDEAEHVRAPVRARAQSEGGSRDSSGVTVRSALCRTPRGDRPDPRRKVSFGNAPEDEPMRRAAMTDSEDEDTKGKSSATTPPTKHRDSLVMYRDSLSVCSGGPSLDSPEAMAPVAKQTVDVSIPKSSIKTKVSCKVSTSILGLAMLIGLILFLVAGRKEDARVFFGDPACWVGGFRPEYCCFGPGGNSNCWDEDHTYDRCCLGKQDE